jgi:hypothetical protein
MQQTQSLLDEDGNRIDDTGDPEVDALLSKPRRDFSNLAKEYGELGISDPLPAVDPALSGSELEGDGRPQVSPEQTDAEFDAALIRMARRGVKEFGNADVMAEMQCDPTPSSVSRRFKAMCDDHKRVMPPGLAIERIEGKAGRYLMTRLMPASASAGGDVHAE